MPFHSRKWSWKCRLENSGHLSRPQCVKAGLFSTSRMYSSATHPPVSFNAGFISKGPINFRLLLKHDSHDHACNLESHRHWHQNSSWLSRISDANRDCEWWSNILIELVHVLFQYTIDFVKKICIVFVKIGIIEASVRLEDFDCIFLLKRYICVLVCCEIYVVYHYWGDVSLGL